MITVVIVNILAVLFAYLTRYKQTKYGLKASFVLIFLFLALRYGYGNDYFNYLYEFIQYNNYYSFDYFAGDYLSEAGWILLCRLFKPFGFFAMTAVLALFNCLVIYRFIKKYVPPAYYWFAVFLYAFNPGLMLIHSSAMQQSVAINLFILSIDYLYKKDAVRYILCIGLGSLFHASALILLPVYMMGLFNIKINKLIAIIIFSLFLSLFWYGKSFMPSLDQFISTYFVKYKVYQGGQEIRTGLGIVFSSVLLFLLLFYIEMQKRDISLLFKLTILSIFFIPLGLMITMIGRVAMYFQPAVLAAYPIMLMNIQNHVLKTIITVLLIFITLYSLYIFFQYDNYGYGFGTYTTIFSSPEIY